MALEAYRQHRGARARAGDALVVPRLRDERDRRAGAAGRPRRAEAGPPPGALRDARHRPAADPAVPQVRLHRRRGHGQVPPARRLGDLRHAGADGAGLLAALHAGRRPGELRLDRRRPGGGDAVHRGPPRPAGDRAAARHRRRHRRLRPQLRRIDAGAAGPAGALPEPAGQRHLGDRGRDGDQHPAAQPARGRRRGRRLHRRPGDRPRRPDGAHQRPGLPRRRHHEPRGDPRRLRLGPRQHQGPRPRPRRAAEGGQGGDRRHRAPVHGQEGRRRRPDHEDRRPRPRQETRGDLRPARRERRTLRDAAGDRAQTRRSAGQSRPQQPLQKNRDAVDLRRQHGGAGRRRAADAEPAGADPALRRTPARGRHPPHPVRTAPRRGSRPHPRGAAGRARQPRRGDQTDPRLQRSRRRARRADREIRALARAGAGDPRHAPAAPDRARGRQSPRRARRPDGADRRAARDPRRRSQGDGAWSRTSWRKSSSPTATSGAPNWPTSRATSGSRT